MLEVLSTSLLILMVFIGLGGALSLLTKSEDNLIQTLIIGVAVFIVILNAPIRYWSIRHIFFPLFTFAFLISLAVLYKNRNRYFKCDAIIVYVILLVGFGYRLFFATVNGVVTTIEPTQNHDDIYYIFTSSWLNDNPFNPLIAPADRSLTYQYSAPINSQVLPRVGAESITAFFSNIFNLDIHIAYAIMNAMGYSILCAALLNISVVDIREKKEILFKYIVIFLVPSLGFIWANNNFPTLWGLLLVCGIQYQLYQSRLNFRKADILKIALLTSALICTYPELLTIVIFVFAFFIIPAKNSLARYKILAIIFVGLVTIFLVPFAYFDIFNVAKTTISATNSSGGFSPKYAEFLVMPYKMMDYVGEINNFSSPILQYVISLFFLLLLMTVKNKDVCDIYGLIAGSSLLIIYMFAKNDSYGLMKAIEFATISVSVILSRLIYNSVSAAYEFKIKS